MMLMVVIGIRGEFVIIIIIIIQGGCFHALEDTRDHILKCAFGHCLVDDALGHQVDVVSIGFSFLVVDASL
jgi:hypothetical protein